MPENKEDSAVTLELQIECDSEAQMQKIGTDAMKAAQKNFAGMEKAMNQALGKPLEKAKDLYAEWGRTQKTMAQLKGEKPAAQKVEAPHFEVANDAAALMEQKLDNIVDQIEAVNDKLLQTEQAYAKLAAEKGIGSEGAIKLKNELTALQSKLIGLQSNAFTTEEKLQKMAEAPGKAAEKAATAAVKAQQRMAKEAQAAAEKAQSAYQKSYDAVMRQAAGAAQQAERWAVQAEKAQSRAASRAAKHAEKAYSRQTRACRAYAKKYADAQSDASDKAAKAMEKAHGRMEKAFAKAEKAQRKAISRASDSTAESAEKSGGAMEKLAKTLKGSLKAVFVSAVLYKFFNAFKQNIAGAIAKNKEFSKSLNAVKANLSVAFTPIAEAIMPMLTYLAQGLATVTKYVASFIAAIFGKTYKQAAESTKKLQDKAKAAQNSASRGFDDLHTVDKKEESESSGVDFSALDTSNLNTGSMQKFRDILEKIRGTLDKIKPNLKDFLDKGIKPIAQWVGGKLKDALGFFEKQLGKVGDWFVEHKESFSKIGESLGKLWLALEPILNAGWETLKTVAGNLFDGLLSTFGSLLDIAPDIIDFVTALFKGDWSKVKECGKNVLIGFWDGIKEYWKTLRTLFTDWFEGLITVVKAIFGIHSPSTVFSDIGKNLIRGLIDGIKNVWQTLKTTVTEKFTELKTTVHEKIVSVKDKALSVLDTFKSGLREKCGGIWDSFKEFINKILGGTENMINKPIDALNKLIRKLNALKVNIPEILGGGTIGFNIGEFGKVSIPRLARGGIVNKPTLSLIGEAGREAVVPLQNNTEWMGKLSAEVANAIAAVLMPLLLQRAQTSGNPAEKNILMSIDGQTFAKIVVNLLHKYAPDVLISEGGIA